MPKSKNDDTFDLSTFISNDGLVSVCCSAKPLGDTYEGVGRCYDCKEMSEFKELEDE